MKNKIDKLKERKKEICQRNRQAPIHIKIDDLAIFINDKITRRGIAKGLVSVQEDLNKNLLEVEKSTIKALMLEDKNKQLGLPPRTIQTTHITRTSTTAT